MRLIIIITILGLFPMFGSAQESQQNNGEERKNALYIELAGRGYFSLNYERAWNTSNRWSTGFGWNHHETLFTPEEVVEYELESDHEVLPYLSVYGQYSKVIGKKRSKFEIGAGTVITFYDMDRLEFANSLYETESYINLYPIIGYRYEGDKGFLFMFTFNPLIQIPQGYFWPIPGISFGYRF